ncbi:MAG: beta-galactosidase [Anaerolineales bacterium]|nr:beta-galactosidase [Anaerolineales bacterium]
MSQKPRNRNFSSALIGIWMAASLVIGVAAFALLYWLIGVRQAAPAATVAPAPPTVVALTDAPVATNAPATVAPTVGPEEPSSTSPCNFPPLPASGFGYGIQAHSLVPGVDPAPGMNIIRNQLNLYWSKIQVRWQDVEPEQGSYNWVQIDNAMDAACKNSVRVMLSVVASPAWAQANPLDPALGEAPPDDTGMYVGFLAQLIDRYPGQIGAIEIWNEANLEREWNVAGGVSPRAFAEFVQASAAAIKARDASIFVISGAPAPTGANCFDVFCNGTGTRRIVMDDAQFLTLFLQAGGAAQNVDCIGVHSNGTNLPPTSDGAHPPAADGYTFRGPWNSPHYSWAMKSQVETYAKILSQAGSTLPQCMTEFGYASPIDGKYPPGYDFAADVSEDLQAEYLVEAYNYMRDSGYVKMAFLFNLDYAPLGGEPDQDDNTIFSIIGKGGFQRPAFSAIGGMDKP